MKFFKNFIFEVCEWFADVKDNIVVADFNNKIKALEEDLEWEIGFGGEKQETLAEWGLYVEARDKALARINAREARHAGQSSQKQAVMQ